MKEFAPIILFVYNRLKNTRETVDHLLANSEAAGSDLFVFSDAPKNESAGSSVNAVREYLHKLSGFRSVTIIEREDNYGLVRNIVSGVSDIVGKYGKAIVLEDDLSVSPFFLKYMNEALERFEDRDDIACIHGYVYPHRKQLPEVFLVKGADCWGWATWKRAWSLFSLDAGSLYRRIQEEGLQHEFDFSSTYPYMKMLERQANGEAASWAVCWYASAFLAGKYTVYPDQSMVAINSLSDGGTHDSPSPYMKLFTTDVKMAPIDWEKGSLDGESMEARKEFESFFNSLKSLKVKIHSKLRKLFKKR